MLWTDLLPVKFLPKGSVHAENRRSISSITGCSKHISCKRQKSREGKREEKEDSEKSMLLEEANI